MTHYRSRSDPTQPSQFLRLYDPEALLRDARGGDSAAKARLISNTPLEQLDALCIQLNIDPTNQDEHGDPIVD